LNQSYSYLLVVHGSRDSRQQSALAQLCQLLRQELATNAILDRGKCLELNSVITLNQRIAILKQPQLPPLDYACLEFASLPLAQTIVNFAQRSKQAGYRKVLILPLFLLPGVHVTVDLPTQVNQAQQILGGQIDLELGSYLGNHFRMFDFLQRQFEKITTQISDGRILLAHGSRRVGANQPCQILASQLQATPAYWSVPPYLPESIEKLVRQGKKKIAILPYFLFTGKITEAIAQQVAKLQQLFPGVELILSQPLGATAELANLILEGAVR
jgi:sirohydrochlorin ferrochelatase